MVTVKVYRNKIMNTQMSCMRNLWFARHQVRVCIWELELLCIPENENFNRTFLDNKI